ncbi:MAG TPA: AAA family ATPase [Ktedonobacterales bacterium]
MTDASASHAGMSGQPGAGQIIRLFVSSTFADFQRERELLQRHVFPDIAKLCRAEGFRFLPIDLRWGVSEEAGSAQRTLPIIFEELRRCQRDSPDFHFLLLLGDRYGSRLLPHSIPTADYARLAAALRPAGRSLLERAYRLDENAVPPAYVVLPLPPSATASTREAAEATWRAEVATPLLEALADAAPRAGLSPAAALRYTASVTHREIVQHGLLHPLTTGDPSAALCVIRTFTTPPGGPAARDYVEYDPAAREGQARLRAAVEERLAAYLAAHPEQDPADLALRYDVGWDGAGPVVDEEALIARLRETLERRVRAVIARRRETASAIHPVVAANARFAAERLERFVGREQPLATIAAYLAAPAEVPLLVTGPGGVGKSTLMARAVKQATADYPQTLLLTRYVGVTPGAESLRALLDGVRAELAAVYGQELAPVQEDWERERAFREALAWATAERPLILALDALDQLGPSPLPLGWLPETLPPHVHLVASLLDELDRTELAMLTARQSAPRLVQLGEMDTAEGDALLSFWLTDVARTLTPTQRSAVLAAFSPEGRPLYLRLAFEEARRWRSFDAVESVPPLEPTIPGILDARFARLERPDEHGPTLTCHTLGLLRAAKNGLAEDELLALLARDAEVREEQRALSPRSPDIDPELPLPTALWALLYADLAPYLSEREADGARLFTYYHRQLAEVAAARYLQPPDGAARHQALARYFEAQPLLDGDQPNPRPNLRKLSEQPTQEAEAGDTEALRHTLTSVSFLERRIAYQRTLGALADLALAPSDDGTLGDIAAALRLGAYILDGAPDQTESQLRGRLPEEVRTQLHEPPDRLRLRLDSQSLAPVGGPLVRTLTGHTDHVLGCALNTDGTLALSASYDKTLRLWEVASGRELRRLEGHTGPVWGCALSTDGALALSASSDKTLRLWEVASGRELQRLEGHTDMVAGCALSADGRLALSASWDKTLRLWEVASGRELRRLEGHTDRVLGCALNTDGTLALSASYDNMLRLWEVASGRELRRFEGHTSAVYGCALSTDGALALSASSDTMLRVWEVASGRELQRLEGHTSAVDDCALSADGRLALSASWDKTLRLWEVASGKELRRLEGHTSEVRGCALSADGALALSASYDTTLRVWEVASGKELRRLEGHTRAVLGCALSADGALALSASDDYTLRLWEVASGREVVRWFSEASLYCCAFSPPGWRVMAGDLKGAVHVLSVLGLDDHRMSIASTSMSQPPATPATPAKLEGGRRWWRFWRRGATGK